MMVIDERRVRRSGSFLLQLSPREAFPLFTAKGEQAWVPDWSPTILGSEEQDPGLVFLTGEGQESTIWTVIESDPAELRHRYSRVTPGVRAGIVEVGLSQEGSGCRVQVHYDMTALPGAGDDALAGYGEAKFNTMLAEWKELIEAWVVRSPAAYA